MWLLAGVLVPAHAAGSPCPLVVPGPLLRHAAPLRIPGVEASDVRASRPTTGYLTQRRRLQRRRALATLRSIAADRRAIPLEEILEPLGIPLEPRPQVVPLCVPPVLVSIGPTSRVHVAAGEQQIVLTGDVRSCVRRLSHRPADIPPILLVCLDGKLFLNDGHHRLVASRLLGVPIAAEVHGLNGPLRVATGRELVDRAAP